MVHGDEEHLGHGYRRRAGRFALHLGEVFLDRMRAVRIGRSMLVRVIGRMRVIVMMVPVMMSSTVCVAGRPGGRIIHDAAMVGHQDVVGQGELLEEEAQADQEACQSCVCRTRPGKDSQHVFLHEMWIERIQRPLRRLSRWCRVSKRNPRGYRWPGIDHLENCSETATCYE